MSPYTLSAVDSSVCSIEPQNLFEDERTKLLLVQLGEINSCLAHLLTLKLQTIWSYTESADYLQGKRTSRAVVLPVSLPLASYKTVGSSHPFSGWIFCLILLTQSAHFLLSQQPLTWCKTFCTEDKTRWDSMLEVSITYYVKAGLSGRPGVVFWRKCSPAPAVFQLVNQQIAALVWHTVEDKKKRKKKNQASEIRVKSVSIVEVNSCHISGKQAGWERLLKGTDGLMTTNKRCGIKEQKNNNKKTVSCSTFLAPKP